MSAITTINAIEKSVLEYTPLAIQTILAIEKASATAKMAGSTKLDLAISILSAAAQGVEQVPFASVSAWASLVNFFVAMFNTSAAAGLFHHNAALVTPAPAATPAH